MPERADSASGAAQGRRAMSDQDRTSEPGRAAAKSEPRPSATVVVLRDAIAASPRLEFLLLQRSARDGKPGPWVFPGGKVEAPDVVAGEPGSRESALRAAVRETHEEAGIDLAATRLVTISRWITPEISPQRFDTWFFLGVVDTTREVVVCGSEIIGHRWIEPAAALSAHARGEIQLAPPTFVTVTWLTEHALAAQAQAALGREPILTFRPRIHRSAAGMFMLYPGDAGYDSGDAELPGARHRIHALASGWRYERSS
jgi:8-oxo-dGTP pyrophosphatase MutT (NUDIX family)